MKINRETAELEWRTRNMEQNGVKKVTRSRNNKMICGVCGGIGEYFNIDPTVVRLLWAILTAGGFGSGLLVYIIAAIVVPEEYTN